jgi:hypothetical protein
MLDAPREVVAAIAAFLNVRCDEPDGPPALPTQVERFRDGARVASPPSR